MKMTMGTTEAADRLLADDNAAWSYEGARALVEYLEEIEKDTGEEIEFDRVALRCEFSEYDSAKAAAAQYDYTPDEEDDEDEQEAAALGWLNDRTQVIAFNWGVIIQYF